MTRIPISTRMTTFMLGRPFIFWFCLDLLLYPCESVYRHNVIRALFILDTSIRGHADIFFGSLLIGLDFGISKLRKLTHNLFPEGGEV
jgi:hypothetical protein